MFATCGWWNLFNAALSPTFCWHIAMLSCAPSPPTVSQRNNTALVAVAWFEEVFTFHTSVWCFHSGGKMLSALLWKEIFIYYKDWSQIKIWVSKMKVQPCSYFLTLFAKVSTKELLKKYRLRVPQSSKSTGGWGFDPYTDAKTSSVDLAVTF